MIRLIMFFLLSANNAIATIQGETLICDNDRRGYNFITEDKVEVLSVNFDGLIIISNILSYQLNENTIFIKKPLQQFNKLKEFKLIGWIFRRTLDYVSLDYVNGDLSRKFLWSCEIITSDWLEKRLKNKLDKFIKANRNKIKEYKYD